MKTYTVEVTDTWRVEVQAKNKIEAYNKVAVMSDTGYNDAIDLDGANLEVID